MSTFKTVSIVIGVLLLGALGALIFNVSVWPYLLASTYFENFPFIKNFKEGTIIVNKKEQVYIQENTALENAIEKVKSSIVTIRGAKITSGLITTSDGAVVTLANSIGANGNFKVFLQGEEVSFHIVKIDYKNNLALLKIDKNNLQTVGFADFDNIKLGQKVFLVASVPAVPSTTTLSSQNNWLTNEGIIREIDKDPLTGSGQVIKTNILEKAVAIGGPLFNSAGELVGLNFIDSEGKISAVPVNKIQELLGL